MKLLDLFLKNKTQEAKDYETLLALSGNPDTPLELINSLRIQQGLSVLVDRDRFPKGTRILSKHETNKLFSKEPNLLEIKLKDTDSVPEVWYKGERLDELPKGLVDVSYHWKTDGFSSNDRGTNDINIEYYSTPNDKYLDKKIIGHKRYM
ncbi:TPA: hypothetical protein QFS61_001964 [Enterococcus faecium]|uniref:hypothetical protein n=1 Tax=Enterococcus faecium TaxID=1352 RepID=UPI0002A3C4AC|nr:hypothetical protein [Enterococcus faecium]ELB27738.1 hypothetical protein OIU_03059 [Enterococcus faecium EnGen0039]MBE5025948.1 hypothetical protein [Enterococcus faecium]MDQ8307261.1 hypothetical protein [Enterococcus faecium]HAQ3910377.1 hypothetical protein [Enterococcus faecium]